MVPGTKGQNVEQLDPEQLKFVEILAKLMAENEVFKEEYTAEDFAAVIDWLTKLRAQIDITIESLQDDT
jgi:aromatic ring-cleaving dioxygenase